MSTTRTLALLLASALTAPALSQAIGPDLINSSLWDIARYGTDAPGTTTAYAIGAVTCNRGDLSALVAPSGNSLLRPLIAQNIYRLKTYSIQGTDIQRFEQVGQSWVKRVGVPASAGNPTCGTCQPTTTGRMGVNCSDLYGSGFNGAQSLLGPRSMVSAALGSSTGGTGTAIGDTMTRARIQVPTSDIVAQPAGTRFFAETVHLLPDDAQYIRPGQTIAINAMNNAASQEINIAGGTGTPTLLGAGTLQIPAIARWKDIDPGVVIVNADHDDTLNPSTPGTFIRCRFNVAAKATLLSPGLWRYEYAIFNLNSDRAAGSFTLPLPAAATVTDLFFHHPLSHSGEPYSNAPWSSSRANNTITFATETFAQNSNANALRWGTTYNIGFTTNAPPTSGAAQLSLFAPGPGPAQLLVTGIPTPLVVTCGTADFNNDGDSGTDADIEAFFACLAGNCCPSCWELGADFNGDGDTGTDADIESFFRVLAGAPC